LSCVVLFHFSGCSALPGSPIGLLPRLLSKHCDTVLLSYNLPRSLFSHVCYGLRHSLGSLTLAFVSSCHRCRLEKQEEIQGKDRKSGKDTHKKVSLVKLTNADKLVIKQNSICFCFSLVYQSIVKLLVKNLYLQDECTLLFFHNYLK